jgi:hypothetical protein
MPLGATFTGINVLAMIDFSQQRTHLCPLESLAKKGLMGHDFWRLAVAERKSGIAAHIAHFFAALRFGRKWYLATSGQCAPSGHSGPDRDMGDAAA